MNRHVKYYTSIGLKVLDSVTTLIGLNYLGRTEMNFIPALFNKILGSELMVVSMFAAHFVFMIFFYNMESKKIIEGKSTKVIHYSVWGLNIILLLIVISNIIVIGYNLP